jgi:hypothetical protein
MAKTTVKPHPDGTIDAGWLRRCYSTTVKAYTKQDLEEAFNAGGNIIPCVTDDVAEQNFGATNFQEWFNKYKKK